MVLHVLRPVVIAPGVTVQDLVLSSHGNFEFEKVGTYSPELGKYDVTVVLDQYGSVAQYQAGTPIGAGIEGACLQRKVALEATTDMSVAAIFAAAFAKVVADLGLGPAEFEQL